MSLNIPRGHVAPARDINLEVCLGEAHQALPANSGELVLFDLSRATKFSPLFRTATDRALSRVLQNPPRNYTMTVITSANTNSNEVVERVTLAGQTEKRVHPLGLDYPREVYPLSHVALPFAMTDALYGQTPDSSEDFGVIERDRHTWRGWRIDRQPGFALAHVVQCVLPLYARTH